ncbi:MAG: M50 family metallopeptidase [Candidatus Micrarchaeota archaeon]|nr:M50 family metallopeptidase [Candidatus Micrarchaeota archaeon]
MVKYFELDEVLHILVSVITISIAFAIAWTRSTTFDAEFLQTAGMILLTVGSGFVLHELAHKFTAIHYGAHARYQAWTLGLLLAVVMAFAVGFVFAAPGAVYIYGNHITREQNGKISIAGPLTNLALGFIFLLVGFALPAFASIASLGANVNFFLGAFNLLPFFPMDGQKVYSWNKLYWAALFVPMLILAFVQII